MRILENFDKFSLFESGIEGDANNPGEELKVNKPGIPTNRHGGRR